MKFARLSLTAFFATSAVADTLIHDGFASFDPAAWTYAAHASSAPASPVIRDGAIILDTGTHSSSNRAALGSTSTRANPFSHATTLTVTGLALDSASTTGSSVGYLILGREETDTGEALTATQVKSYSSTSFAPYDGLPSGTPAGALALNLFKNNATGAHSISVYDFGASASSATWTLNAAPSAVTWVIDGTGAENTYAFTLTGASIVSGPSGVGTLSASGTWVKDARFGASDLAVADKSVSRIVLGAINAGNLDAGSTTRFTLGEIQVSDTSAPPSNPPLPEGATASQIMFGFDVDGSTPLALFPGVSLGVEWGSGNYSTQASGALSGDVQDLNSGTVGQLALPPVGAFTSGLTVNATAYDGTTPVLVGTRVSLNPTVAGGLSLLRPQTAGGAAFFTGDYIEFRFEQNVEIKSISFSSAAPAELVDLYANGVLIYRGSAYHLASNPLNLGRVPLAAGQVFVVQANSSSDGFHLATLTVAAPGSPEPVSLPRIFGSGTVLQRDTPVPVWGKGKPGETITVSIAGQTHTTTANSQGTFEVTLAPQPAGGPYELIVSGSHSVAVTSTDVCFGDVWLCGGQSNMWYRLLDHLPQYPGVYGTIPNSIDNFDDMRVCFVANDNSTSLRPDVTLTIPWSRWKNLPLPFGTNLNWMPTTPYFFGRALKQALNANGLSHVPIGILISSQGGTNIEQWISQEALAAAGPWPSGSIIPTTASDCYNAMLGPIERFPIKGAVWYQGENNSGNYVRIDAYKKLKETLVGSWRAARGADFPFYFVQLASWMTHSPIPTDDDAPGTGYRSSWAWIREAQTNSLAIPRTAMAVAIDTGDQTNIHPSGKDLVGQRLALLAQADAYGLPVISRGPTLSSYVVDGFSIILTFDNVGDGLTTREVDAQPDTAELSRGLPAVHAYANELLGFTLCGADKVFFHATHAEIIAPNQIRLSNSADVPTPVAVRYAWQSFPQCNLFGGTGLPAEPFRTDAFARDSAGGANSTPTHIGPTEASLYAAGSRLVIDLSAAFRDIEDRTTRAALVFTLTGNSAPSVATASLEGNQLTLTAGSQAGTADITVTATDSANKSVSSSLRLSVEFTTFAAWQHRHFAPEELADPSQEATVWGTRANPDGDRFENLLEYALGTHPDVADPAIEPISIHVQNGNLIVRYRRSKHVDSDASILLLVETSTGLASSNWSPLEGPETVVADLGEAELRELLLPHNEPRRFARLSVHRLGDSGAE